MSGAGSWETIGICKIYVHKRNTDYIQNVKDFT